MFARPSGFSSDNVETNGKHYCRLNLTPPLIFHLSSTLVINIYQGKMHFLIKMQSKVIVLKI